MANNEYSDLLRQLGYTKGKGKGDKKGGDDVSLEGRANPSAGAQPSSPSPVLTGSGRSVGGREARSTPQRTPTLNASGGYAGRSANPKTSAAKYRSIAAAQ